MSTEKDSTPENVECPTCQGVGSSYEDHVGNCPDCGGEGVTEPDRLDHPDHGLCPTCGGVGCINTDDCDDCGGAGRTPENVEPPCDEHCVHYYEDHEDCCWCHREWGTTENVECRTCGGMKKFLRRNPYAPRFVDPTGLDDCPDCTPENVECRTWTRTVDGPMQTERRRMVTIGSERMGLRITKGKLDRHGRFHDNWPCIFVLWQGRRRWG